MEKRNVKLIILLSALVSSNALAVDFDTEWSKFMVDFNKIEFRKLKPVFPVDGEVKQVDPKDPQRLGNMVSDPVIKTKLMELYNRPDVVVFSTTVR